MRIKLGFILKDLLNGVFAAIKIPSPLGRRYAINALKG